MSSVAVRVIALAGFVMAAAAEACTVPVPFTSLAAMPAGAMRTLVVDVVALKFEGGGSIADVRVVRAIRGKGKSGDRFDQPYLRSPCGERREPHKAERLVAYVTKDLSFWATLAEARRFDPAVR